MSRFALKLRGLAALAASTALLGIATSAHATEVTTRDGGHVQNPSWSPDGEWLAFEINNMQNSVELWLAKASGGTPTSPSQVRIPGAGSSFGTGGYLAASPTWATQPNLMLVFEGANPGGTMRLYYATPGAGAPNELITQSQMEGNLTAPEMSPNGKRFAFVSDTTGNGDIYVWDLASGDMAVTVESALSENSPAWDDNGNTLAFSRGNNGTADLFTWSTGGLAKGLKGGNGDQTRPVWQDGQVIYFTSERGDGMWDIAVSSGVGDREIIARDVRLPARAAPAISPDGKWVAYGSSVPEKSDRIMLTRLDGSSTVEIETGGLKACGEPSLVDKGGRLQLAFTALPAEGSAWRTLHVVDISGKL